jgi:putative transposase
VRYTQRLAEAGAVASVGSTGDSYDNALAEAFNSLFKALIPPAEHEDNFYRHNTAAMTVAPSVPSLH